MRNYLYEKVMVILRQRKYQGMTFKNISIILNRNKIACWFAPDYIWTGIHIRKLLAENETLFDAVKYNKEQEALIEFLLVNKGLPIDKLVLELKKRKSYDPEGLEWTDNLLKKKNTRIYTSRVSKEKAYITSIMSDVRPTGLPDFTVATAVSILHGIRA